MRLVCLPWRKVDDIGGDIGKINNVGGGNGGGNDDYYNDSNEDEDGEEGRQFRRRMIDSVLNEWNKTIEELPAGLRQAYHMGLVSSPEMVKHLATHPSRPTTITRFISRSLPLGISRSFNDSRVQADPAFLYRLLLGYRVIIDVLTVAACNALAAWSISADGETEAPKGPEKEDC